jgi:hypothetical protein
MQDTCSASENDYFVYSTKNKVAYATYFYQSIDLQKFNAINTLEYKLNVILR